MLGSNNEVAVLDAVLGSLAKSPAFAEFEAPVPEPIPVISMDFSAFMAHIEKMEDEDSSFTVAGDFFNEQMPLTLTASESAQMDEMERLLNL